MPFGVEVIDSYVGTFLSFLRLRPRRFVDAKNRNPSRYMSSYQFLYVSLTIGFVICTASVSLEHFWLSGVVPEFSGKEDLPSPEAISVLVLTLIVAMFLLNSLHFRIISRWWPIRSSANFESIFKLQCYAMGIRLVPLMALELILEPIFIILVVMEALTYVGYVIICMAMSALIGTVAEVFWDVPGLAVAGRVSTRRCWYGIVFWVFAPLLASVGLVLFLLGTAWVVIEIF